MSIYDILQYILLLGLGSLGAVMAVKLNVPTGAFLGPIVLVAVYQVFLGSIMEKPSWLSIAAQISVGLVLGSGITKSFLTNLKNSIKPTITVCSVLISGGILLAFIIMAITDWDIVTCILATAPGGQAEMTLLADSVGAQSEKVITLQLVRTQLIAICLLPLARLFIKKKNREEG